MGGRGGVREVTRIKGREMVIGEYVCFSLFIMHLFLIYIAWRKGENMRWVLKRGRRSLCLPPLQIYTFLFLMLAYNELSTF